MASNAHKKASLEMVPSPLAAPGPHHNSGHSPGLFRALRPQKHRAPAKKPLLSHTTFLRRSNSASRVSPCSLHKTTTLHIHSALPLFHGVSEGKVEGRANQYTSLIPVFVSRGTHSLLMAAGEFFHDETYHPPPLPPVYSQFVRSVPVMQYIRFFRCAFHFAPVGFFLW
ncbi:hypothetical protein K432DRAFT_143438 [Lepidopterella palustris CBS 459.81]|uniref:Uncharacterized protein n=1 Tax=Lepidopterella palustris CBS 459.81 TaxID=1314670 RepID=A0A8E2ELE2_9PEZI|nr:hypothetical protein K432DRAFT_143438 [Lepidopterella palustris CBS 459.81]